MYAVVLTYILLRELDCYVCYLVVERGKSFSFVFVLTSTANIDGLQNYKNRGILFFS